jgi:hypothetical protein
MLPEPSVSSRSSTEAPAAAPTPPSAAPRGRVLLRLALGAWAVLVHVVYYLGYLHVR